MREWMAFALVLLLTSAAAAQTAPENWKAVKDSKGNCQISVPPDWEPLGENNGAAVFQNPTTAIAVVTSQPGQEFKPFTPAFIKTMGIPAKKMFENSSSRIFYQDKTSGGPDDPNGFSSAVPAKAGTCSCHLTVLPTVSEDTAKKVMLSLSPATPKT